MFYIYRGEEAIRVHTIAALLIERTSTRAGRVWYYDEVGFPVVVFNIDTCTLDAAQGWLDRNGIAHSEACCPLLIGRVALWILFH